MSAQKTSTKEKILIATELLLAEHGFEAVQCRYINPINEQRIELLAFRPLQD